jgi:adenine-specific DNA-methyltransferase
MKEKMERVFPMTLWYNNDVLYFEVRRSSTMATGLPSKKIRERQVNNGFQITYEGKTPYKDVLSNPPATLEKVFSYNPDQTESNRIIYGDNLNVLANLLDDPSIAGNVNLIYIDPPYATKQRFESRKQNHAYDDNLDGAEYLEFLRQRLILMRELLAEDGSIYVHLDQKMIFAVKIIMDEVFGPKNFRNFITRKKCNPKNFTRNQFGNISDHILYYAKSEKTTWNQAFEEWTDETSTKEYNYFEAETGRRYKKVPIHAPGIRNGETGKEWKGMLPPPGKHWQYVPKKLDEMDLRGEIYWSPTGNPRRKVYLDNSKGIPVQDIWLNFKDAHNQNIKITGYPTEKNPDMLKRIIESSSNTGDIVLDAFAGSGSTLDAAGQLGRKWIGIDNSHLAIATILHRFANGTEIMGDFVVKKEDKQKENIEQLQLFEHSPATNQSFCFYKEINNEELDPLTESNINEWKELFFSAEDND